MKLSPRDALMFDCQGFLNKLVEEGLILPMEKGRFRQVLNRTAEFVSSAEVRQVLAALDVGTGQ